MKLADAVNRVIAQYGTANKAGVALGIDSNYLYRMTRGEKSNPKDEQLAKLGLKRVVSYEFVDGEPPLTRAEFREQFTTAPPAGTSRDNYLCGGCVAEYDGALCLRLGDAMNVDCIKSKVIFVRKPE